MTHGLRPAHMQEVTAQQDRWAVIETPAEAHQVLGAINQAFVHDFCWVMLLSAGQALGISLCAWQLISKGTTRHAVPNSSAFANRVKKAASFRLARGLTYRWQQDRCGGSCPMSKRAGSIPDWRQSSGLKSQLPPRSGRPTDVRD